MAVLAPPSARSVISDDAGAFRIEIPVNRSAFHSLFLTFWLGGWACGEFFAVRQLLRKPEISANLFLISWLGMWTVFGVMAIWSWFWMLSGREVIRIGSGVLAIRREVFGIGATKEYSLTEIRDLRVGPPEYQSRRNMIPGGTIVFDYGAKTYRFGQGVDEAEAKQLVREILSRYPIAERTSAK